MKNSKYTIIVLVQTLFVIFGIACKEDVPLYRKLADSKGEARVFIGKANSGMQKLTTFPYDQDEVQVKFNTGFGAVGLPANPIHVLIAEDQVAFDSLNNVRANEGLPPYEHFPTQAYNIDNLNLVIPQGSLYSDYSTLTYHPKGFDSEKDYLLALSIKEADGYNISPTAKSIIFVVNRLEEKAANTSGWIAEASSEEPGQGTGLASAVLDGNLTTIWHSRYKPAPAEMYPHWLSFDMLKEIYVTKVSIATRQNNLKGMKKFKLEGSRDGDNWFALTDILDFDPTNINYQTYHIEPQYLKKIKITMLEGVQDPTFLSEFVVYSY